MFEGLQCFEYALKFDPDYALALTGLADSYTMLCLHSYFPPEEAWPKAAEAIDYAEQIGAGNAEVHGSIATIALLFERNWGKAEKEYLNALKINPHYLQARSWYAVFYLQNIRSNQGEALKQAHIAVENDPLSSYAHAILSTVASNAGFNDEAIAAGEKSVEFDPESFLAWYYLGYSHHNAGNHAEAVKAYNQLLEFQAGTIGQSHPFLLFVWGNRK